jgi:transcriptional regulator with XRE-family HTH domain
MDATDATQIILSTNAIRTAIESGDVGAIVRCLRVANHLTLAQLGQRCGYSAATVSRMERGLQPLRDVEVLSLFANVLGVHPEVFGLTYHASVRGRATVAAATTKGDDVLRREFLLTTGATLVAGRSTSANVTSPGGGDPAAMLTHRLDLALQDPSSGSVLAPPMIPPTLRQARSDYRDCRYGPLSERLATLISSAEAAATDQPGPQTRHLLAETYNATARALFKADPSGLEWTATDRAVRAAQHADDPLVLAEARRLLAIAYRRAGWHGRSQDVTAAAAEQLGHTADGHDMAAADLLCTAAYAAAKNGDRERAVELLNDADRRAHRARRGAQHRTAFGPAHVAIYRLSVFSALGDLGASLSAVRAVHVGELPTAERRARFLVDAARAFVAADRHGQACQALLMAARMAPMEVRTRPAARTVAAALSRTGTVAAPLRAAGLLT